MCARKARTRNNKTTKYLGWIVAILLLVLVALLVLGPLAEHAESSAENGGKDDTMTQPYTEPEDMPIEEGIYNDDMIVNISEQDDTVIVSTAFGQLRYPFAFSDVIRVVPVKYEDYAAFEFYGILEHGEYLLYKLWIGNDRGRPAGYVTDRAGEMQEVYFEIAEAPGNLQESDRNTFYAAQETANDVLSSFITHS